MDLELDYKKTMSPEDKSNCFPETSKVFLSFSIRADQILQWLPPYRLQLFPLLPHEHNGQIPVS